MSLPMRERGLKFVLYHNHENFASVAPHAGAWIEIILAIRLLAKSRVAPHAGAWIEMSANGGNSTFGACRSPCGGVD